MCVWFARRWHEKELSIQLYIYVCMYACMHACMHVCMYMYSIHIVSDFYLLVDKSQ